MIEISYSQNIRKVSTAKNEITFPLAYFKDGLQRFLLSDIIVVQSLSHVQLFVIICTVPCPFSKPGAS